MLHGIAALRALTIRIDLVSPYDLMGELFEFSGGPTGPSAATTC
jgi:hypothetical protein